MEADLNNLTQKHLQEAKLLRKKKHFMEPQVIDPVHNSPTPQDTIQNLINPVINNIYLKIQHNAPN